MSVAKNTAKDIAGEAEQVTGAVLHNKKLEREGRRKRDEAAAQEEAEEAAEGFIPHDEKRDRMAKPGEPDFQKSTTLPVDKDRSDS